MDIKIRLEIYEDMLKTLHKPFNEVYCLCGLLIISINSRDKKESKKIGDYPELINERPKLKNPPDLFWWPVNDIESRRNALNNAIESCKQ